MTMQEIVKSNEQVQVDPKDINKVDVKNLTEQDAARMANEIVKDPDNVKQINVFPDLWNSLDDQQKSDFVSRLEGELKDAIKDLKDLGIEREYSPEVSQEDMDKVANLNFVRENKDRIPESWSKLEMKAKEVAQEMAEDIKKEGLDRDLPQ